MAPLFRTSTVLTPPSPEVQVAALLAARDMRSSVGSNLAVLSEETGLNAWTCSAGQLRTALLLAEEVPVQPGAQRVLPRVLSNPASLMMEIAMSSVTFLKPQT